jgi:hypothetical protein
VALNIFLSISPRRGHASQEDQGHAHGFAEVLETLTGLDFSMNSLPRLKTDSLRYNLATIFVHFSPRFFRQFAFCVADYFPFRCLRHPVPHLPSLPSQGCDRGRGYDAGAAANRHPQTLSFLSPYYQQLADRLFGFSASRCWKVTFCELKSLPSSKMDPPGLGS